jgi:RimJ/RimL family protein N-acetyltransferase
MELQTERLILRSFCEKDVDVMAQLFANPNFMRFSLGVFTERKQTVAFIEKVIGWDRDGIPSQFAVIPRGEDAIVGYCGFFIILKCRGKLRSGTDCIPITGTAALSPKPRVLCAITALPI